MDLRTNGEVGAGVGARELREHLQRHARHVHPRASGDQPVVDAPQLHNRRAQGHIAIRLRQANVEGVAGVLRQPVHRALRVAAHG
eukprot:762995-Alexandrium_andersonii.AAC.1